MKMFKSEIILLTLFCAILCTALGQEDKIMLYMAPALVGEFRKCADTCGNEYGVDPKAIRKVMDGTIPDDEPHKHFLFCVLVKGQYMDETGHIIIDGVMRINPINATPEKAKKTYMECNKITQENYLETAHKMAQCYYQHFTITFQKPNA